MKKTFKAGAILTIIGLLMILFGFSNHGFRSVIWRHGFHLDSQKEATRKVGKVTSIELATNQPVTIVSGNVKEAQFSTNEKEIKATNSDGVLKVSGNVGSDSEVHFLFGSYHNVNGVKITIPQASKLELVHADTRQNDDITLRNIKVNQLKLNQSGETLLQRVKITQQLQVNTDDDIRLSNVTTPTANIKSSDGDISIQDVHFSQPTGLKTADGDITVKNSEFTEATVATADGDVELKANTAQKVFKASTDDGDIQARIQQTAGLKAQVQDGDLKVDGHNQRHTYQTDPTAKTQYQLRTFDGDITVHRD